jgi:hypothetical protein
MRFAKRALSLTVVLALSTALLLLSSVPTVAQTETGQVTGTLQDSAGAVLVGATVTAKSASTGQTRSATTNSSGSFTIPSLRPGAYNVTYEAKGFQTTTHQVTITVGATIDASAKLNVGGESTTIEVTAAAAVVNTENQTLGESVTASQLTNLPTSPTRNPYALVGISGNVTEDSSSVRGAGYAINGMRSASTDVLLDGGENVNLFTATVGQTVPLDSVQEFSVLTNNYTAEYGRASGGVVNVVTKSGTNSFHGSAYEYNRVSKLSSNTEQNDATGTPKGRFTRNDFGFSIGGPIKKNKLFFFNNLEWIRVRSASPTQNIVLDPASYGTLPAASQAFFTQFGTLRSNIKTLAKAPCAVAPAPGSTLTCDAVSFAVPADAGGGLPQNTWMEVARVDYNLSSKTTLFGRYASYKELDFPGTVNTSPYAGYDTGQTSYNQNFALNLSHVFTPSFVDTVKVIYNRLNIVQPLGTNPVGPTLYSTGSVPNLTVAGISEQLLFPGYNAQAPGLGLPFGGPQNVYQFYNDVSWTRGKHQFKFGGEFLQLRDNRIFGAYENPVEQLGTTIAGAFTNLLNGQIYQFQGAIYPQGKFPCVNDVNTGKAIVTPACTLTLPVGPPAFGRNFRYNDAAWYVQDSWKMTRRLTVNLGLRWEYYGVQHNANPALDSNFVLGPGSTLFDQIRNGQVELSQNGGFFWRPKYGNFAPRVGFAWDVFGDGKTALRGGYAIGYERNFGNVTFNAIQNPPNYGVISLVNASAVGAGGAGDVATEPVYTNTSGPLAGSGTKALPVVSQRAINQNIKTAYAETWNLALERQIGRGVFSVAYAGSHGVHLYDIANINASNEGGVYLGDVAHKSNRLNLGYSNMNFRSDNGFSRYNAMNVKYAVSNLHNTGLGLTANYTWSHAEDNLSSTFSDGNGAQTSGAYQLGYLDAFNPALNFGNADFDIRHRASVSWTWEVPWMKSGTGIGRAVLGGWALGSVFSIRSGSPFTIYDGTNTNYATPLWVAPSGVARTGSAVAAPGGQNLFNYISLPADASGNVLNQGVSLGIPKCTGLFHQGCVYTTDGSAYPHRNQYFGPGYWNTDLNVLKNFKVTERIGLQFRAEMYNILNHHNQYVTGLNLDVTGLSTPFIQTEKGGIYGIAGQSTDERRNIQLGLKVTF